VKRNHTRVMLIAPLKRKLRGNVKDFQFPKLYELTLTLPCCK